MEKTYYERNKEARKAYRKLYYQKNREKEIQLSKLRHKDTYVPKKRKPKQSKEIARKKINKYQKERKKKDPVYRKLTNIRTRTWQAIFNVKSWQKDSRNFGLFGCDRITLINHIESQFDSEMNWSNHGEWEIDHIIPLKSAVTVSELNSLSKYRNIRPLWKKENRNGRPTNNK